jgi:uncharacterized protein YjbJ (UPF0337 family)
MRNPLKTRPNTASEDRVEGIAAKGRGRLKEAGGALTGDRSGQAAGRREQAKGAVKNKRGLLKKLLS